MLRNFKVWTRRLRHEGIVERITPVQSKSRRVVFYARLLTGSLVTANLVTALILFGPWNGQTSSFHLQLASVQAQVLREQQRIRELTDLLGRVQKARAEGDQFIAEYFLDRRTAYSTVLSEMNAAAENAGIIPREHSFAFEPIEGSEFLDVLIIVANYRGSYEALLKFLNQLDRSERFLIVDSLQAVPRQGQAELNISIRIYAFVREERASS